MVRFAEQQWSATVFPVFPRIKQLIIHMKKLLNSYWLTAMQFKFNISAKSQTAVQITHCNSGL